MSRPHPPLAVALAVLLSACAAPRGPSLPSPASAGAPERASYATAVRELTADQQVQQVLNRLAFGPRPGDAARLRAVGVDRWIDAQLRPASIPDQQMSGVLASYEMLDADPGELVADYRQLQQARRDLARDTAGMKPAAREDAQAARRQLLAADPTLADALRRSQRAVGDIQSAKLARAVMSDRQLQEVMVDFWENHFSVFAGKGLVRFFLPQYDAEVIRPRALGKFRDLLGAVAKSPAMLFYLDNWQSMADSAHPTLLAMQRPRLGRALAGGAQRRSRGLNENYARELMELHTLGVDGGYTQQDVIEVARALTGWTLDPQRGTFVFRPAMHDAGEKVILGKRFPAGHGQDEGEAVLDLLARNPSTAKFIARKLAVRLVSDDPPQALVDRAAETFRRTDGDIAEVVRTIVTSPEFFSRAAYRAKVKTPFELVASALRAVGAGADTTPRSAAIVARLGQPIFGRQTPDGWPDQADAWMNTGAILNRINFGLALAAGRIPGATLARWPEADSLRRLPQEQQVDGVVRALLGGEVSTETRGILVNGENPLAKRGGEDVAAEPMQPSRMASLTGLPQIVGLALGAPEFQRR